MYGEVGVRRATQDYLVDNDSVPGCTTILFDESDHPGLVESGPTHLPATHNMRLLLHEYTPSPMGGGSYQ